MFFISIDKDKQNMLKNQTNKFIYRKTDRHTILFSFTKTTKEKQKNCNNKIYIKKQDNYFVFEKFFCEKLYYGDISQNKGIPVTD